MGREMSLFSYRLFTALSARERIRKIDDFVSKGTEMLS